MPSDKPAGLSQTARILLALAAIVVIAGAVLAVDALRGRSVPDTALPVELTLTPGGVPIYLDGQLVASFTPADLDRLQKVSFVEPEQGKTQEGWLLHDILRLHLKPEQLSPDTQITVSSSSRKKSAELTWAEVAEPANMVMFDLSNRNTLKLVSVMPKLDTRDEWVQDTDRIDLVTP